MALEVDSGEDDTSLGDLIVKMHGRDPSLDIDPRSCRRNLCTLPLREFKGSEHLQMQTPRTTSESCPLESEEGEVDNEGGHAGTGRQIKRRDGSPLPEPESHLRVWMPACMVRYVLPDFVDGYEAALEAKRRGRRRKYREYSKGICFEEEGKAYVSLYDKFHRF